MHVYDIMNVGFEKRILTHFKGIFGTFGEIIGRTELQNRIGKKKLHIRLRAIVYCFSPSVPPTLSPHFTDGAKECTPYTLFSHHRGRKVRNFT